MSKKYDLVIIDIMLPENISAVNPSKNAGVELIEDIEILKKIKKPTNIIGITSDEEVYNEVKLDFDDRLIPIINHFLFLYYVMSVKYLLYHF